MVTSGSYPWGAAPFEISQSSGGGTSRLYGDCGGAECCARVYPGTACEEIWIMCAGEWRRMHSPKYIGVRKQGTDPVQLIPRGILTPIVMQSVRVDTTGAALSGVEIGLPCGGVWEIAGRVVLSVPTGGDLSRDANIVLFMDRNGPTANPGFIREFAPADSILNWDVFVNVDRTELLGQGDRFQMFVYWDDPGSTGVQELQFNSGSITAEFVTHAEEIV